MMTKTAPARRSGIFYGWYIIGMCMVAGFLGAGTSQLFMAVMLKPMTDEMGWSRTEMAGAVTAGTLAAGFLSPWMGRLTDRFGGRVLMPAGALIVAGAYFALGSLTELWQFYVVYIIGRAVATVTLGGVVPMAAAANWFRRMRGRALGMVQMSLPLGGSALVFVGQLIMGVSDWRTVFFVFTALMLAGVALPAGFIMRRRPEDMGLLPDGDGAPGAETAAGKGKGSATPEFSWTLREALRTRSLWLIIASVVPAILGNGAISFHQVAYFTDIGVPAAAAALALSAYGLAGAFSSGIWGFITERISERWCGVFAMLMAASSVVLLLFVSDLPSALLFSIMFGVAARGEGALISMILAQYYGRESYGSINGFVMPFQMVALGLGPTVAAAAHEFTGSYSTLFMVFAGMYVLAALLLFLARKPALPPRAFEPARAPVTSGRP
jgi:sugar phosphate permease